MMNDAQGHDPQGADRGPDFRSGFVGLAGVPNVGKSTLVNALIGQKVSIVSRSAQTTRHRVCGILTDKSMQAVLVDVPGILDARDDFNSGLVRCAAQGLLDCDLILHLRSTDTLKLEDESRAIEILKSFGRPIFEIWTKVDLKKGPRPEEMPRPDLAYAGRLRVSARTGRGLSELTGAIGEALPRGPLLYPEDDLSDRDLRFLCAEIVREKVFRLMRQEIPYGVATWVEDWKEPQHEGGKLVIRMTIQTDREAHKRMIVGSKGTTLRRIGSEARTEIEGLVGQDVFLELWVRVKAGWRKSPTELERLGLNTPD